MGERVGSDNPSVRTVRGRLVRRGGTRRPAVEVPDEGRDVLPADGTVRLVVDGRTRHAPVVGTGGSPALGGAFDNARLARERAGTDRLAEWVESAGVEFGRSVLVDVVEADEVFGLRSPGETAVYEVERGPPDGLSRIAEDLDQ